MWVQARLWDFNPPVGPVFQRKSTGLSGLVHKNEPDEWWGKAGRGDFQTHKYRLWCFAQPPAWSWVVHYILRRSILYVYFATCVWFWQAILRTEKERGKGTRSEISWPVNYELVDLNIKITVFKSKIYKKLKFEDLIHCIFLKIVAFKEVCNKTLIYIFQIK